MRTLACVILFCISAPAFAQNKHSHDFRGSKVDEALVRFYGPRDKSYMTPEKEGLRLRYTGKDAAPQGNPAGVISTFKARGNFVATARYEILRTGKPAKGTNGIGVEVYLMLENRNGDGMALVRTVNREGGPVLYFNVRTNNAAGKRISKDSRGIPATDRSLKGRLRLAREGAFVIGSFAEGDDEQFQELQRSEVGNADVRMFRFNGHSGDEKNAVLDMRMLEFNLEGQDLSNDGRFATALPKVGASAKADAPPAAAEQAPSPKRGLLLILMLAISLFVIVGVVVFLVLRKAKNETKNN